jgi:hypothetical protein
MFHDSYVVGMSRFTPSPPEYDAAMREGISPALRRGPLSFSNGMPLPNDGVMHDMIMSGSMAAASSPGFFTQEEARATKAVTSRGAVDDQNGWADARAHATGRDDKYNARWKEMLANQGVQIALLKATFTAKKRNTDLAFLIGGNDGQMDEEMRTWYDAHRQDILRPPATASSSTSTPAAATPATDDASPPKAQEGTADEPVIV